MGIVKIIPNDFKRNDYLIVDVYICCFVKEKGVLLFRMILNSEN